MKRLMLSRKTIRNKSKIKEGYKNWKELNRIKRKEKVRKINNNLSKMVDLITIKIIKIKTRVIIIISTNLNKMVNKKTVIIIKAFKRLNKTNQNQIKTISNLNQNPTKDKTNSIEINQLKIIILTKNSITIIKATAETEKVILITKGIESSDYQTRNVKWFFIWH